MTWQVIEPHRSGPRPRNRVTARVDAQGRMQICLGGALIERLGWQERPRVSVEIGEGNDIGKMRLVPITTGGFALSRAGGSGHRGKLCRARRVTVANWAPLSEHAHLLTSVSFRVVDGAVEISLPRHWIIARVAA